MSPNNLANIGKSKILNPVNVFVILVNNFVPNTPVHEIIDNIVTMKTISNINATGHFFSFFLVSEGINSNSSTFLLLFFSAYFTVLNINTKIPNIKRTTFTII